MVADQCKERRAEAEGAGTHRRQILLSLDSHPKMGSRDEQPSSLSSFSKIRPSWDHFTGRRRSRRTTASVDSFHSLHKTGEASDLLRDAIMQDMGTQDAGAPLQMSRAVLKAISKLSRKRWKTLESFLEDYKLPPVIGRKVFHIIIRISNRELNLLDVDAGAVAAIAPAAPPAPAAAPAVVPATGAPAAAGGTQTCELAIIGGGSAEAQITEWFAKCDKVPSRATRRRLS